MLFYLDMHVCFSLQQANGETCARKAMHISHGILIDEQQLANVTDAFEELLAMQSIPMEVHASNFKHRLVQLGTVLREALWHRRVKYGMAKTGTYATPFHTLRFNAMNGIIEWSCNIVKLFHVMHIYFLTFLSTPEAPWKQILFATSGKRGGTSSHAGRRPFVCE